MPILHKKVIEFDAKKHFLDSKFRLKEGLTFKDVYLSFESQGWLGGGPCDFIVNLSPDLWIKNVLLFLDLNFGIHNKSLAQKR